MKNLKIILAGIFVAIAVTEVSYPILGTRRREAYVMSANSKKKEAAAYEAGLAASRNQDDSDYSDSADNTVDIQSRRRENNENQELYEQEEVEIQRLNDQDDYSDSADVETQERFIDKDAEDSYRANNSNYVDPANSVLIQALGDGSMLSQFGSQLSQVQKDALKIKLMEKMKNSSEVQVQALEPEAFSSTTDKQTSHDASAVAPEKSNSAPVATSDHAAEPVVIPVHVEEVKPATAPPVHIETPTQVEPTTPIQANQPNVTPAHIAEPVTAPMHIETPIAAPTTEHSAEQVKIVKIYPVYDTICAALTNVKTAAQDMFNYVFGVAKAEKADVKIQAHCTGDAC